MGLFLMSRMLEALRQIEAKQDAAVPRESVNEGTVPISTPAKTEASATVESPIAQIETISEQPADIADYCDEDFQHLDVLLEEELAKNASIDSEEELTENSSLDLEEELDTPPCVDLEEEFPAAASEDLEGKKTATASEDLEDESTTLHSGALEDESTATYCEEVEEESSMPPADESREELDVFDQMAQYIIARLESEKPAALLFTSATDNEGTSQTLCSLAKPLEEKLGGNLLLVDADFQRHDAETETGLHVDTERIRCTDDWRRLLEQFKEQYQLVLIDGPSLFHAETAAIARACDGVYLAVRLSRCSPQTVREAARVIHQTGARLLGAIAVDG
ncbi:MAG: hypothetical protein ACWGMZ_02395 [Thermoguttaceae bacterium]